MLLAKNLASLYMVCSVLLTLSKLDKLRIKNKQTTCLQQINSVSKGLTQNLKDASGLSIHPSTVH